MTKAVTRDALAELNSYMEAIPEETYRQLIDSILAARTIACYGVGREGLMIKAFTMRLFHVGFDAHVVGDMTTPRLGEGDVLIVSAGPGGFSTVEGLQRVAHEAGARVVLVTAHPEGSAAELADVVVALPGPTMAEDLSVPRSALLMGSIFEIVQLLFYDVVIMDISQQLQQAPEESRRRHTNLE